MSTLEPERIEAEDPGDLHRQVFEKNRAVQILTDPDSGRIVEANRAACRFYGYARDQLVGLRLADLTALTPAQVAWEKALAAAERRDYLLSRHRLASGDVRDVEVHSGPVDIAGRRLLLSIVHDVTERRRAEEALRQSEEKYRAVLESIEEGYYEVDLAGRLTAFNDALCSILGYERDELPGVAFDAYTDGVNGRRLHRLFKQVFRSGRAAKYPEFEVRTRGGEARAVRASVSLVRDAAGRAVGFRGLVRDITEQRVAEEALRASEERYRRLVELSPDAIAIHADGRLVFVNTAGVQMLGASAPEELLGRSVMEFVHAECRSLVADRMQYTLAGYEAPLVEQRFVRLDGAPIDVEMAAMPFTYEDRPAVQVVVRDITERKRAEDALRQSEQFTNQIIANAGEGLIVYDRELRYLVWNPAMEALTGLPSARVIGRKASELFPHLHEQGVLTLLQRALAGATLSSPDVPYHIAQTGRSGWVSGTYGPHRDANGEIIGAIGIVRDVTERKRAERLQQALYRLADVTASADDLDAFYGAVHAIVAELMYARNFYIALYDEPSGTLQFPYFVDERDPRPERRRLARGLTERVLRTGEPVHAPHEAFAVLVDAGEVELIGAPSLDWLGVPLKRGERTFGALVVQSYTPDVRFTAAEQELLTFVSQHVASALDRKQAAEALRQSEARFRRLAESAPCLILIHQGDRFRYVNPAAVALTGYSRDEFEAMEPSDLIHVEEREAARARFRAQAAGHDVACPCELRVVTRDGQERWLEYHDAGSIEFGGERAVMGAAFDVTERKRAEEQVRSLAYHDALTGLPNRLLFNDRLSVAVAQAHRTRQHLAVVFLDLDRFKLINDSLGHSLGDVLLRSVAARLQESVREGDTVARLGGDEFILLLSGMARGVDMGRVAAKVLDSLRSPFLVEGRELFITASIGISVYPEDGEDAETLVKNADTAMYRAKEQGRDNYQLYAPTMNARALERLGLENSLRKALAAGELEVYYQPLLDVATGEVHGVEALLRWQHPERGLLLPAEFISLAEITGLIVPIAPWVLRTACAQVRAWQERGHPDLCVAVNLSARQFQQADLLAQVTGALRETGLAPRCLDLEITESNAMQSAESAAHTLRELKALGVRISIDDFGVGYSSLGYLKRLPIDTLKIDQSFVRDITTDPDDAAIATAVIALAHSLKLTVVAEGVETEPQRAFLAARGCDRMQGFLFSRALPPGDCELFLARHARRVMT